MREVTERGQATYRPQSSIQINHDNTETGRGQIKWALKSTFKALDFMPRGMEGKLNRRMRGSNMCFQIFVTLAFS